MRAVLAICVFGIALTVASCGGAPNEYPASARERFDASCPADNAFCACTWDKITRAMTYEEYEAAVDRLDREGLVDPRITRARTSCRERHAG